MIDWTDSAKIIISANATKFMANSSAELTCAFPSSQSILMWHNQNLPYNLMCKNKTSCDSAPGYILSRHDQNITLIIKKVVSHMNSWRCSDLQVSLSEYITFAVIDNPPLKMTIVSTGASSWELTTSCSNPPPVINCMHNVTVIPVNMSAPKICSENLLSSLRGTIQAQNFMYVKCQAKRGTEVAEAYGLPKFELKMKYLPNCIYRIESSCTMYKINFTCINNSKKMNLENVVHDCQNNALKSYTVELKGMAYGTTFNCTTFDERSNYSIQETVSCQLAFYTSGGLVISIGLVFVGAAVTMYLFNIGMIKNANTWKFVIWYIGIIFVDVGVMLFLWTLSWEFVNTVFLPFFLLLVIKDITIILIGLYIKKNGGFFFMNSSKIFTESASPDTQNPSPKQSTPM